MTALLAAFEGTRHVTDERSLRVALSRAAGPWESYIRVHHQPGAILGVAGYETQGPFGLHDCPGFAVDEDYVVLVDGTFYYLNDLSRAIGQTLPRTASPARIVLAAFRSLGKRCVEKLEGDFSFVVWNRHTREVFCGRDFSGRRPLFVAEWQDGLVVASSLDSIAALPRFRPRVDLGTVGADAAGLFFALDDETCMRGVKTLRSGHVATWTPGKKLHSERVWWPRFEKSDGLSLDDAAVALRKLISAAVVERMSTFGDTSVWMSGGRDSSAVFAAGMNALSKRADERCLVPISRSHPPGDSGREDEAIEAIARFWGTSPSWVYAQNVPMFAGFHDRTAWGSESFAQPFEGLARALSMESAARGTVVALDGYGGDFLFQVSRVYIADLLASGRVADAVIDWRAMDSGREGLPGFVRYGVQPVLPRWAKRTFNRSRGGLRIPSSMERTPPPWINPRFIRNHAFAERFAALGPDAQQADTAVDREAQFYLTHQFFARVNSRMAGFAFDHGVELRSPLFDARVVRFALSRPRAERNTAGDHKRLLRASMTGLLPESVLASRTKKTGTLTTYFSEHMWKEGLSRIARVLPACALVDAGVVSHGALEASVAEYRLQGPSYRHIEALFCTLQAEIWLRARSSSSRAIEPARRIVGV
jgi:asparagine synthase (glutamine-hydrolysing)